VRALDAEREGWIHAHENVGVHEMDERKDEVEKEFQRLVNECREGEEGKRTVRVEHVERVKMYAPGVVHAVFDVYISGAEYV
jgi:tRNA wybutosine-synthesizing protein 2